MKGVEIAIVMISVWGCYTTGLHTSDASTEEFRRCGAVFVYHVDVMY